MPHIELEPDVRAVVDETLEHFNANRADTVLLLACYAAGAVGAYDAAEPGAGSGLYDLVVDTAAHAQGLIATAFGAGESRQITRIRKHLRHQLGMPASCVSMSGYWRQNA